MADIGPLSSGGDMGQVIKMPDPPTNYHYSVYEHRLIGPDGILYTRAFIVLKNQYGIIVRFTRLHNYLGIYEGKVCRPITADGVNRARYVCMMLNYILIKQRYKYHINHVFDISKEALVDFLSDYALTEKANGGHRGRQSIEKCVSAVTLFMKKLVQKHGKDMRLKKTDLYTEKDVYTRKGRIEKHRTPDFQVPAIREIRTIFRDIPTEIFQILLEQAIRYTPDIALAVALQAFAGLRPGEVCNVRQEDSPLGKGISFTFLDGRLIRAEIDLTREIALRSDGVNCGRIKKERRQCIYSPFLDAFYLLYQRHLEYLRSASFEQDYRRMFVNSRGMAMTYGNYRQRFTYLIEEYLRPYLIHHEKPELRIYGQLLYENHLGPHALRHWFSVQLALRGEDVAQLQFWRGDSNPQSAFLYLQNKGDLLQELSRTNELLSQLLQQEGKKHTYYGADGNG